VVLLYYLKLIPIPLQITFKKFPIVDDDFHWIYLCLHGPAGLCSLRANSGHTDKSSLTVQIETVLWGAWIHDFVALDCMSLLQCVCCFCAEFSTSVKLAVQSSVECPKSPSKPSACTAITSHRLQPILHHDLWPSVQHQFVCPSDIDHCFRIPFMDISWPVGCC